MIIVFGTRHYGKVDACGPHHLATRFFHIWYLPLIPVGATWITGQNGNTVRGIAAPFSVKSMFAGYFRVWGVFAIIGAIIGLVSNLTDPGVGSADWLVGVVASGVSAFFALIITVVGFAVIGKLSMDDKRKRATYAMHTGLFIDPKDLPTVAPNLRQQVFGSVMMRAQGLAGMGYRFPADPSTQWAQIALDPTHNDADLVTAAFTLSRIDASMSQGPYKMQMEQANAALWNRINQMRLPHLLQVS